MDMTSGREVVKPGTMEMEMETEMETKMEMEMEMEMQTHLLRNTRSSSPL